MKALKEIDIVFENCDAVKVFAGNIQYFNLKGITSWHHCGGLSYSAISIQLGIKKCDSKTWEELINRKDITHIHLYYTDNTDYYISVPYQELWNCWEDNAYQSNTIVDTEDKPTLYIVIEKHLSILSIKNRLIDVLKYIKNYLILFKEKLCCRIKRFIRWK